MNGNTKAEIDSKITENKVVVTSGERGGGEAHITAMGLRDTNYCG